LINQSRL